jgi:signal transduction histidine kinase/DNA-binding response OmpR family regulator
MGNPYRILIVEDDPEINLMLSRAFSSLGYEVVSVDDGFQALERVRTEYFNAVILDLMLPGHNGIEILKHIRKQWPTTEVIMLTAYASLNTALEALRMGAYDYVTKPFPFDVLRSAVRRAIEKQRLETKLEAIYELSREMALSLSVERVAEVVLDIVERVLEFETCNLMMVDKEQEELYLLAERGTGGEASLRLSLSGEEGITVAVLHSGEPVYVPDVHQDPRYVELRAGTRSELAVPLKVRDRVIGVLDVESAEVDTFSQADVKLLSSLAAQAAVAMENARLYERAQQEIVERRRVEKALRRHNRELTEFNDISATIIATLELDQVLQRIVESVNRLFPQAYSTTIQLLDETTHGLVTRAAFPEFFDTPRPTMQDTDGNIAEIAMKERHPINVADVITDLRFVSSATEPTFRSLLVTPLMFSEHILGTLSLKCAQPMAFGDEDECLVQLLSGYAAIAVANARLFEQLNIGREQLQALSRRHVEAQEAERAHIARELHDETGQALSAMLLSLSLFERQVDCPEAVIARAAELEKMVDEMLGNLHRLAMNLRPASLDLLGLVPAMAQYIETFGQQHGITTHFETLVGIDGERLPAPVETALYRIVQEALTNVIRHAQATRVDVLLERRGDRIVTIVEDDGVGFDIEKAMQNSRLGLFGMRERAEMLDGVLTIESAIGMGTTVFVEIPYDQSGQDV